MLQVLEYPGSPVVAFRDHIVFEQDVRKAEQCLIDNGIDPDEVCTVLQALGYILLDSELYPEEV